ncbi:MAG: hypothetical protein RLZZ436_3297 [Planctomycetota bacterium]|jgi:hypothetical protein
MQLPRPHSPHGKWQTPWEALAGTCILGLIAGGCGELSPRGPANHPVAGNSA